jgi:hypothetical protein
VSAGLTLFAAGSNYCLIAALSGDAMACLALPTGGGDAPSHCGHGDASGSDAPSASSCCVSVAPVAVVSVAKQDAAAGAAIAPPASIQLAPIASPLARAVPPDEGPPLSADPCRARLERAPPLS